VRRIRSYNERKLRAEWRGFLRTNAFRISLAGSLFVLSGLCAAVFVDGYALGAIHGFLVAAFAGLTYLMFAATGHSSRLYGQWGEQNTRDCLKSARRRRHIYGFVDNLEVRGGDVDHLVLAPSGVLALDSKWHGQAITAETLARDRDRALASARRARSILRSEGLVVDVAPVVVIWGGQQGHLPNGVIERDGLQFVSGNHLSKWLRSLHGDETRLKRKEAAALGERLAEFRRRVRPSAQGGKG
jgi:hypothetical protein